MGRGPGRWEGRRRGSGRGCLRSGKPSPAPEATAGHRAAALSMPGGGAAGARGEAGAPDPRSCQALGGVVGVPVQRPGTGSRGRRGAGVGPRSPGVYGCEDALDGEAPPTPRSRWRAGTPRGKRLLPSAGAQGARCGVGNGGESRSQATKTVSSTETLSQRQYFRQGEGGRPEKRPHPASAPGEAWRDGHRACSRFGPRKPGPPCQHGERAEDLVSGQMSALLEGSRAPGARGERQDKGFLL